MQTDWYETKWNEMEWNKADPAQRRPAAMYQSVQTFSKRFKAFNMHFSQLQFRQMERVDKALPDFITVKCLD